jgi:hypothetical protein
VSLEDENQKLTFEVEKKKKDYSNQLDDKNLTIKELRNEITDINKNLTNLNLNSLMIHQSPIA